MKLTLKNFRCYENKTFHFEDESINLLSGISGKGKCLGINTPVLMYNEDIKKVQDIKKGDFLMGFKSDKKTVLSCCNGISELYKIIPNKGESYVVNIDHILTLAGRKPYLYYDGVYNVSYINNGKIYEKSFNIYNNAIKFFNNINYTPIYDISLKEYFKLSEYEKKYCYTFHRGTNTTSRNKREILLNKYFKKYGYISNEKKYIKNSNHQERKDIIYLALSLGYMAYEDDNNIIHISKEIYQQFRVESIGYGEYYGFELDGDGRFLLGDFTVTHNSSILMAINFALYGKGNKVVSHGKSSCYVELDINNINIVRTKRPNRLVVNNEHIDEAGQHIINDNFGKVFDVSGYISQNAVNSFIMMGPLDKLAFLEKFSFSNINLSQMKDRCKSESKIRNNSLISIQSKLEMAKTVFEDLEKPQPVQFPIKCKRKNRPIIIDNEKIKYKNCSILIKRNYKKIDQLSKELSDLKLLKVNIENKNDELKDIRDKLSSIEDNMSKYSLSIEEIEKKLKIYEKKLKNIVLNSEIECINEKYEEGMIKLKEMKEKELTEREDKIKELRNKLWQNYTPDDLRNIINEKKQCIKDTEEYKKLKRDQKQYRVDKEELEEKEKELELSKIEYEEIYTKYTLYKQSKELYKCPNCQQSLKIKDGILIESDIVKDENIDYIHLKSTKNILSKKISSLEKEIPVLNNNLERYNELSEKIKIITEQYEEMPDLDELKDDLDDLRSYQQSQKELENRIQDIEKEISDNKCSEIIKSHEKEMKNLKSRLEKLTKSNKSYKPSDKSEEELRESIYILQKEKNELSSLLEDKEELKEKEKKYSDNIDNFRKEYISLYENIREISDIEEDISKSKNNIKKYEKDKITHENNLKKIEIYEKYEKELNTYIEWESKIEDYKDIEEDNKNKLIAINLLKEKILETESLCIFNTIQTINMHAKSFLDDFFPNDNISVVLKTFKTNTNKPQINVEVIYKEEECDLNSLSGGELSRVILAYTLALSEMFNLPLIMLDECTSSLDQETTGIVMDSIRNHFPGKLILVVAHQVINGTFDNVLKIN